GHRGGLGLRPAVGGRAALRVRRAGPGAGRPGPPQRLGGVQPGRPGGRRTHPRAVPGREGADAADAAGKADRPPPGVGGGPGDTPGRAYPPAVSSNIPLPRRTPPMTPPSPPRRVLIVDDYEDSAESTGLVLRVHGYDVRTAKSADEALAH